MYSPSRIGVSFHKPRTPLSVASESKSRRSTKQVEVNENSSSLRKNAQQIIKATLSPRSPLSIMTATDMNHQQSHQDKSPAMITVSNMKKHNRIMKSIRSPLQTNSTKKTAMDKTFTMDTTNGKEAEQSPVRLAKNTKSNSSVKKSLRRHDASEDMMGVPEGTFTSPRIHENQEIPPIQHPLGSTPQSICSEDAQSDNCPSSVTSSVYMKYSQGTHDSVSLPSKLSLCFQFNPVSLLFVCINM